MERKGKTIQNEENFWYPLDNAAKIFPAITTDEVTSVFRISVNLKKKVNIKSLFKAVRTIEPRFPYYKVKLKKGFFWYYFESSDFLTPIVVDDQVPCRSFDLNGSLFRVLVINNKLSIEFSHMLADGGGAFEYFKTLLATYFELTGVEIPSTFDYIKPDGKPDPEEFEDAYSRYFKENIPASVKRAKAFHLPFALNSKPRFDILYAIFSFSELNAKAKEKGVNITVYLAAVYMYVLQEIFESLKPGSRLRKYKKLSLEVPINLRKIYPTKTMRNFTLFVLPEIDLRLGHFTFDEIVKTVYHQMQLETDEKLVNKILAKNVGSERMLLIRSIPLFLKSFVLKLSYYSLGSSQYTGVFTNLGGMSFPPQINDLIESMVVTPPPPNKHIKVGCGIVGFNDKLVLSFCSISKSKELEKRFIQFLVGQGIRVKLTTNK
jgi:hypothetical protein